jgi:exodeoxyribonuclease V alpha subunit
LTDLDVHDVQRVRRAAGLLRDFNDAGVLAAADVHVALRLGRLGGEDDERVLLAAALTVRALRAGSVHLDVASAQQTTAVEDADEERLAALTWPAPATWVSALEASRLVAVGVEGDPSRPLRLMEGTLYLDRYWRQEQRIADVLDAAALRPAPEVDRDRLRAALDRLFPGQDPDRQRLAAAVAAHRWVSVLAGGPGTGKTTTVAKLLALLQDQAEGSLRIALAAPTAVAANRLTLAARAAARRFAAEDVTRLGAVEAVTLHRLLGFRPDSRTRFRHDRDNRLPFDVVVVDEASMVSLTLMARLVDALRPDCRLVLVGDPDQLASVEAGAVLGDLVQRPAPAGAPTPGWVDLLPGDVGDLAVDERAALDRGVVRLAQVHRFSEEIQSFAAAVRSGDPLEVAAVLARQHPSIEFVDVDPAGATEATDLGPLRTDVVAAGRAVHRAATNGDGDGALRALAAHRTLCAHREGPYGVSQWSDLAEAWLRQTVPGYATGGRWYVGRPLLMTSNDYQLRLFNGDTGVVVDVNGSPRAAFLRNDTVDLLAPGRLSDAQTVHAMSVHRSQGSQFERVTLVLPPADSPLLTRELLYTGLTRAKEHVRIIGTREALAAAVRRPIVRASGLRLRR